MSNEYDIEKYDREREERIKHLETLKEQAEEEFNSYHNEKRESFEDVEDNSSAKKKLIGVATIALLGFAGYFGYNQLSNSSSPEVKSADKDVVSNQNNTTSQQNSDVRNQIESIVSTAMKKKEHDKEIAQEVSVVDVSKMVADNKNNNKKAEDNISLEEKKDLDKKSEDILDEVKVVENKEVIDNKQKVVKDNADKKEEVKDVKEENIKKDEEENKVVEREEEIKKENISKSRDEVVKNNTKKITKEKPNFIIVRIREGDTLASLSEKYYGNPMYYKRILRANRGLRKNHLVVGQRVIIPELEKEFRERLYRIRKGDTLYKISKRFYGTSKKIQKIIDANYKIKSESSSLHVGDLIYIPK